MPSPGYGLGFFGKPHQTNTDRDGLRCPNCLRWTVDRAEIDGLLGWRCRSCKWEKAITSTVKQGTR